MKLCECGCGNYSDIDRKGRPRKYIRGHKNVKKIFSYIMPKTKTCKQCKKEKDISNFRLQKFISCNKICYYRPRTLCKSCESKYNCQLQKSPETRERIRKKRRNDRTIKSLIQNRIAQWKKKTPNSDLTTEYLLKLYESQNGKCYYTGLPLEMLKVFEWKQKFENSISLDRLDPDKGYVQGNLVFCLYSVNTMKGKHSEQQFYERMKMILINHKQINS